MAERGVAKDRSACGPGTRAGGDLDAGPLVSLPVLASGAAKSKSLRGTRMGKWRAGVLIAVHLVIAAHIVQWLITGMTVSPVEPSETMYTLERGHINAGFVMFVLAIVSTLIFGRFFCGWACHVVALQDLCAWMMKKCGIRPVPLRSRLLVLAPLVLALYMFVWPTFKREVMKPVASWLGVWDDVRAWVGETSPPVFHSGSVVAEFFQPAFMVRDFWATFPPWYVSIPFLLVCGFACVYLLGAKGFCTYGCPYGGFFAPADKWSIGKIVVNSNCHQCGHCTSVCTSNVRVHEEVRDYGMVVDPGCMKCMDCVAACPNEALSFGFAKPAVLAKPRVASAVTRFKKRVFDWTTREELAYSAVFLALVIGWRGLYDLVPLLMAMGIAGCGTFVIWKAVQVCRVPNVRVQNLQLRLKGRMRPAGWAVVLLAVVIGAIGVWGAVMKGAVFASGVLMANVTRQPGEVFAAGYVPSADEKARAERALGLLRLSARPGAGGEWGGLGHEGSELHLYNAGWAAAVAGDRALAEKLYAAGVERGASMASRDMGDVGVPMVNAWSTALAARGVGLEGAIAEIQRVSDRHPASTRLQLTLAELELARGGRERALRIATELSGKSPDDPEVLLRSAGILAGLGDVPKARELLRRAVGTYPRLAQGHRALAFFELQAGELESAAEQARLATETGGLDPANWDAAARIWGQLGREADAQRAREQAERLRRKVHVPAGPK